MASHDLVLVTGGSGYIGAYCIVELVKRGFRVRTTVRALSKQTRVQKMLAKGGVPADAAVTFVEANLDSDKGWAEAVKDCKYVLHVASPFPMVMPKNEDELIVPAREGTLRVLRAAKAANVQRVVVTSSFAAIGYGPRKEAGHLYNEEDWTDATHPSVPAYQKSKTIAEKAAWDFIKSENTAMELTTVNPVGVFGPVLDKSHVSTSVEIVSMLIHGKFPRLPNMAFAEVDVRDVAWLHVEAMLSPTAAGQRYLATEGNAVPIAEMAAILKDKLGPRGSKIPTGTVPDFIIRLGGLFSSQMKAAAQNLGPAQKLDNSKARKAFNWTPIPMADTLVATADSLLEV